jgi:hypothetical protein
MKMPLEVSARWRQTEENVAPALNGRAYAALVRLAILRRDGLPLGRVEMTLELRERDAGEGP